MKNLVVLALFSFTISGCATNSQNRWALMSVSVPVGATIGFTTTPEHIKESYNTLYFSAIFGLAAAIVGNIYFNDKKDIEELEEEIRWLKANPQMKFVQEGEGIFESPFDKNKKGKK